MPKELGDTLRFMRVLQQRSQYDVGSRAGITQSAVSAFERGTARPSPATLVALAQTLEFDPTPFLNQARSEEPR